MSLVANAGFQSDIFASLKAERLHHSSGAKANFVPCDRISTAEPAYASTREL